MNSGFYECSVMHHRFSPRVHHFSYRVFYFALDLDELETCARRLPFFSLRGFNLFTFRPGDYLPLHEPRHAPTPTAANPVPVATTLSLKQRVQSYFRENGVDASDARILLLTLPRVLGYAFNPVSFYYAFGPDGRALGAIAEVTNTFREMKPYFLGPETGTPAQATGDVGGFHRRVAKNFYVSPFSEVDAAFDFQLKVPGDRLRIQIDTYAGGVRTLSSTLAGRFRSLSATRLASYVIKYPFLSALVMFRIHWHALLLWLKRVPWFAKAAKASAQRDLYRPHPSLASPPV